MAIRLSLMLAGSLWAYPSSAQVAKFDDAAKLDAVIKIGQLMRANYVFPEKGDKAAKVLLEKLNARDFNAINDPNEFAKALTLAVRGVTQDKHLMVRPQVVDRRAPGEADAINETLDKREDQRQNALCFPESLV